MPGLHHAGVNQHCQRRKQTTVRRLRKQKQRLARITIGSTAGERREQQQRQELHAARESELHHRIGQLINQPATAEFVHPEAQVTEDLTVGDEPEVAIVQHLERAMIAHGLH